VKETTYADDDTTWVRNQVCEEKVSSTAGVLASHVQKLFGDDTTVGALCVVGKGWPRETRAWLAQENRFVVQTQTEYNAHGSPITILTGGTVLTGGIETRISYDTTGLFIEDERHVGSTGDADFVWQAEWDKTLGLVTAITEPNGHTTHLRYDSFGRFTGTAIDDQPDHQAIEYDWVAPSPKPPTWSPSTTTWQFDGAAEQLGARPATWSPTSHWRQSVEFSNGLGEVRYRAQRLAADQWIISDYHERDPNSRVVFAGRPVYTPVLEHTSRPAGIVGDQLRYDALGRMIQQTLPTGAERTIDYVAFERTTHESDLSPVHSVLDGQGRALLTERSLPDGTHEIVEATYDPAGRLITMNLAGGAVQRVFTYDTLGRLRTSQDPDLGTRTLTWDDRNHLTSETNATGQVVTYDYDGFGRLHTRNSGGVYAYHYDVARPGAGAQATNLAGRLAWIEEPTGGLDVGYDDHGRQVFTRRRIDGKTSEATTVFSPSGLALSCSYDDGLVLSYAYDPAGRLTAIGDLWQLLEQDASGAPLHELAHNGVDTRFDRDLLSLNRQVTVHDVDGAAIYDVKAERNGWNAITSITDLDNVGLDHRAAFAYDGFARLTSAEIGSGASQFRFGYGYDVLHNMTSRTLEPPRSLGAFFGTQHYAEHGRAPRQLTSITNAAGEVTHTFDYDAAGRQTTEDDLSMTYDAADRLLRVDGLSGGSVIHAYGQDGARVKTTTPDGLVSYFFGDGTAERSGVREHDVTVGNRIIARVTLASTSTVATAVVGRALRFVATFLPWLLACVALAFALISTRRPLRRRALAAGMAGITFAASCAAPGVATNRQALDAAAHATFMHIGFSAGPTLFTDATGHLLEERRYEPFGAPIDARIHGPSGDVVGNPDLAARDLNPLNKRTELATGWSDHGARWMAPETGRWLTPDPPVSGPDAKFMFAPWALHPYQYVDQNPVAYWDPDGRQEALTADAEDVWVAGQNLAKQVAGFGPYGQAAAEVILAGVAIVAGGVALGSAVAKVSPSMATCGGDAECSAWMTTAKMFEDWREAVNARAEAERKVGDGGTLTFYRGTYYYDALQVIQDRGFDPAAVASRQASASHTPGLYLTMQLSTARYYADLAGGQGRGGGPATLAITVPRSAFETLAARYGIALETPVTRAPTPGQTETNIPPAAINAFNATIQTLSVRDQ
jgi:RHS repeat-associated protein